MPVQEPQLYNFTPGSSYLVLVLVSLFAFIRSAAAHEPSRQPLLAAVGGTKTSTKFNVVLSQQKDQTGGIDKDAEKSAVHGENKQMGAGGSRKPPAGPRPSGLQVSALPAEQETSHDAHHQQRSKLPRRPRDHCTCLGMGPNATAEGVGALVSQTSDGEGDEDYRVIFVPARNRTAQPSRPLFYPLEGTPRLVAPTTISPEYGPFHPDDRPTEPLGFIPEFEADEENFFDVAPSQSKTGETKIRVTTDHEFTFPYYDGSYALMSDYLGIAEATCSARLYALPKNDPSGKGHALLSIQEISRLMLERCTTARCAVLHGGRLAEKYGFFSTLEVDDSGEALTITDGRETWVFHILADDTGKGAVWAAQKLQPNHFAVVANMFVIREMNLEDTETFLFSKNLVSVAQKHGWYDPASGEKFDFTKIYSAGEYAHPYYSARRAWRMLSHANPELGLDPMLGYQTEKPTYPFSVPVSRPLTREDVFGFYRDHYENTPFDLTQNVAAGGYGNPMRYAEGANEATFKYGAWERSIDIYRTTMTHVAEVTAVTDEADSNKGRTTRAGASSTPPASNKVTLWYAPARASASVFVPLFLHNSTDYAPIELRSGSGWAVEHNSLWWAANAIGNWMDLRFSDIRSYVAAYQRETEGKLVDFAVSWHKRHDTRNKSKSTDTTDEDFVTLAQTTRATTTERTSTKETMKTAARTLSSNSWQSRITELTKQHWELFYKIMATFQNGYVMNTTTHSAEAKGYPSVDYLKDVGYETEFHAQHAQFDTMRAKLKQYQKEAELIISGQGELETKDDNQENSGTEEGSGEGPVVVE
ncbi:unnamed protein product [Amoebophrya sp. A120]|nr:unnamed protein product [Amoebophrya sp. A120]|eukprot:GSA120T00001043001.1